MVETASGDLRLVGLTKSFEAFTASWTTVGCCHLTVTSGEPAWKALLTITRASHLGGARKALLIQPSVIGSHVGVDQGAFGVEFGTPLRFG